MTAERRERRLTHRPSGAIVDEGTFADMLADWDKRAADRRPKVVRLSLTLLDPAPALATP
jgi:hypothetical protein